MRFDKPPRLVEADLDLHNITGVNHFLINVHLFLGAWVGQWSKD